MGACSPPVGAHLLPPGWDPAGPRDPPPGAPLGLRAPRDARGGELPASVSHRLVMEVQAQLLLPTGAGFYFPLPCCACLESWRGPPLVSTQLQERKEKPRKFLLVFFPFPPGFCWGRSRLAAPGPASFEAQRFVFPQGPRPAPSLMGASGHVPTSPTHPRDPPRPRFPSLFQHCTVILMEGGVSGCGVGATSPHPGVPFQPAAAGAAAPGSVGDLAPSRQPQGPPRQLGEVTWGKRGAWGTQNRLGEHCGAPQAPRDRF